MKMLEQPEILKPHAAITEEALFQRRRADFLPKELIEQVGVTRQCMLINFCEGSVSTEVQSYLAGTLRQGRGDIFLQIGTRRSCLTCAMRVYVDYFFMFGSLGGQWAFRNDASDSSR
jgi:hypothetical protein